MAIGLLVFNGHAFDEQPSSRGRTNLLRYPRREGEDRQMGNIGQSGPLCIGLRHRRCVVVERRDRERDGAAEQSR